MLLGVLAAISASPGVGRAGWTVLSTTDGLADNSVSCMVQDSTGSFWFGTYGFGVSRYDGSWKTFTTADGLAGNYVYKALRDHAGNLWFATLDGVSRYDGSTWRTYTVADGLAGNNVVSMFEDHLGNLWFACFERGVSRFDGSSWQTIRIPGLTTRYVLTIFEDRSGNIWFAGLGTECVARYDGTTLKTFTSADGLVCGGVSALEDSTGTLWLGTNGSGLNRFDGSTWRTFTSVDGLAGDQVDNILEDRHGILWFGGGGVSTRYDGSRWRTFTQPEDHDGAPLLEDRSGNIWLSRFGTGVSRYDQSSWRTFGQAEGLIGGTAGRLVEDRDGGIWVDSNFSGISRYDGSVWKSVTAADGLPSGVGAPLLRDRDGNLWFGLGSGASRYDGSTWRTFTTADGLVDSVVTSIVQDRDGNMWFGTNVGASRYDGSTWRTFTTSDGLASNEVPSMVADHAGNVWLASYNSGVSRFDGSGWKTFTTADGLPTNSVSAMLADHSGNVWFATDGSGVARFDGSSWRTFTAADGLAGNRVASLAEDHLGNLWFGTNGFGVSRYDGTRWRTFTEADGVIDNWVPSILEDHAGNMWFGSIFYGVNRYEPDRVPPQTIFLTVPPRLTAARDQGVVMAAAFGETRGVEFSYRLDGGSWTGWSSIGSAFLTGLAQGRHVFEARSRDDLDNIDPVPARTAFEVDAEPPVPVIATPEFGSPARGVVEIRGTAADPRFASYRVEVQPSGTASWSGATLLAQSAIPVVGGPLATWDTTPLPDGSYDLRLSVSDSLGLVGTALITVIVDNHAPFIDETTPARVPAATGGDVYTTGAETHLYFPPHAFEQDATVVVTAAPAGSTPSSLPPGAVKVLDGYELTWAGALRKPARFTLSYPGVSPSQGALAIYRSADGSNWARLGGTVDPSARSISLAISEAGRYALFLDDGQAGGAALSSIAFTPRVFSPRGGFADTQVGISFNLGKPAPVTVRVFSRSGRLIREVASGQPMGAGANLIRWDGRDRNGGFVEDGVYLVSIEALGHTETKPLAVVN